MSEADKALVHRFAEEVWNGRNLDAAGELFAPDYAIESLNYPPAPPDVLGPRGMK